MQSYVKRNRKYPYECDKKEVQKHNKKLFAEFISNEKNRMMKIMLMFNGFEESEQENLLVCKNLSVKEDMDHITINNNL